MNSGIEGVLLDVVQRERGLEAAVVKVGRPVARQRFRPVVVVVAVVGTRIVAVEKHLLPEEPGVDTVKSLFVVTHSSDKLWQ